MKRIAGSAPGALGVAVDDDGGLGADPRGGARDRRAAGQPVRLGGGLRDGPPSRVRRRWGSAAKGCSVVLDVRGRRPVLDAAALDRPARMIAQEGRAGPARARRRQVARPHRSAAARSVCTRHNCVDRVRRPARRRQPGARSGGGEMVPASGSMSEDDGGGGARAGGKGETPGTPGISLATAAAS